MLWGATGRVYLHCGRGPGDGRQSCGSPGHLVHHPPPRHLIANVAWSYRGGRGPQPLGRRWRCWPRRPPRSTGRGPAIKWPRAVSPYTARPIGLRRSTSSQDQRRQQHLQRDIQASYATLAASVHAAADRSISVMRMPPPPPRSRERGGERLSRSASRCRGASARWPWTASGTSDEVAAWRHPARVLEVIAWAVLSSSRMCPPPAKWPYGAGRAAGLQRAAWDRTKLRVLTTRSLSIACF